jgi:hypothetical protein
MVPTNQDAVFFMGRFFVETVEAGIRDEILEVGSIGVRCGYAKSEEKGKKETAVKIGTLMKKNY